MSEVRRFWLIASSVCAGLALAASGLIAVQSGRGPALAEASGSGDRSVTALGQRLVLRSRQPIAPVDPEQVRVSPAVPFSVSSQEQSVTLTWTDPLPYGASIDVTVAEVVSPVTGRSEQWRHTLTTPQAPVFSALIAGSDEAEDEIHRLDADQNPSVVMRAPGVTGFAAISGAVLAISTDDAGLESVVVGRPDGTRGEVPAPSGAALALLQASAGGQRFGFTATGAETASGRVHDNTLYLGSAADPTAPLIEVTGLDGAALPVSDWQFVPTVEDALVAIDTTGQVWLVSLAGTAAPVLLGNGELLNGFLPGTATLLFQSGADLVATDLASGAAVDLLDIDDPASQLYGRRYLTPTSYLQLDTEAGAGRLTLHDAAGVRTVASVPATGGRVMEVGVSPNRQFGYLTVLDPEAPPEELTSHRTLWRRTILVDLAGGGTREVAGGNPQWLPSG